MSSLSSLTQVYIEPRRAFDALQKRPSAVLPLLLLIASSVILMVWYFSYVDFAWLRDHLTASVRDANQREMARKAMTKSSLMTIGITASVVRRLTVCGLFAAYFSIMSKLRNIAEGFDSLFSFAAWTSLPALLLPIGTLQILLIGNGQLGMGQLDATSLNQLIFHIPAGYPWQRLLDGIDVPLVWTIALMVMSYQKYTKQSIVSGTSTVLIPYAVVYAGWIALSIFQSGA